MESGRLCFVSPFINLMTNTEKADWFVSIPVREKCQEQVCKTWKEVQKSTEYPYSVDLDVA